MNRYPLWKNLLVVVVVLAGLLFALPNVFDQDPSIEISGSRSVEVNEATAAKVQKILEAGKVNFKAIETRDGKLLVRFRDSESQLRANDQIAAALGNDYIAAMTLAPDLPDWLRSFGLEPMYLGLDLRGGVHILIDVDMDAVVKKAFEGYYGDIRTLLRREKIHYVRVKQLPDAVQVVFDQTGPRDQAADAIASEYRDLKVETTDEEDGYVVLVTMSKPKQTELQRAAISQNITTLRNRVNALGVAEPIIQQQGTHRIVVQLPGVQDPSKVKDLLGATATLEYRLEDTEHSVEDALAGRVPPGSKLYYRRDGRPILLKKSIIVTGDRIVDASSGFDQRSGQPAVIVRLDGQGGQRMRNVTTENVGKPMAVVFIETRVETVKQPDGTLKKQRKEVQEVISVANILEPFGNQFQTTGLDSPEEARDLALLLRAGALAAPIEIVEERTIGPSLGQDNIDQGKRSVIVGFMVVVFFMALYYRVFGMVANLALVMNLVLIVGILSLLQATLTLPGIAGIVLTVGMAVDANVLIFERIREEIGIGNTPQASIFAGYEKAFSTIMDANITTLIAAVVLYSFGTGPIKGFAVTLAIGIATSMFTAIVGTRAVINLMYGRRKVTKLSI